MWLDVCGAGDSVRINYHPAWAAAVSPVKPRWAEISSLKSCEACRLSQVTSVNTGGWGRIMTKLHEPALVLARILTTIIRHTKRVTAAAVIILPSA